MKDLVLGFIGAGNMNTAILSGVLRKQMFPPERIWLSNRHAEKLSAFSKLGIRTTTDNRAVARNADILILGVKPQMFGDVLPELKDLVSEKCVISIAAGISMPEELSIIGYNNSLLARCTDPEITSIDSKVEALCTTTVNTLMGVFSGANVPNRTTIASALIKRKTTNF